MNKNHILTLSVIILTALCSFGMNSNLKKDSTLCQFNNIKQEKKFQYLDEEGDTLYIDNKVSVFWPTVINGKPCANLQRHLLRMMIDSEELNTLELALDALLKPDNRDDIIPGTVKPVENIPDNEFRTNTSEIILRLQDMGERLLTYHIHYYAYMAGGAHGYYTNNFATYDLNTNKVLSLSDIIADTTMLRTATLNSIKQTYEYDIDDLFLPDNGLLPLPKEFYFQDQVLHVVYQVYEIASYAQGLIDVPIYPYMLEDMNQLFTPLGMELIGYE